MKRLSLSLSLCVSGLLTSFLLSGCSGFSNIETSGPLQQEVEMGGLSGSVYGGHAPIIGQNVYVMQFGNTGYNSTAKSLLTSAYNTQFGFPTTCESSSSDGSPANACHVTSDNTGSFYVSNYTCTVGYPVYLVATGGTTTSYVSFTTDTFVQNTGGSRPQGTYHIPAGQTAILYPSQQVYIPAIAQTLTVISSVAPTATTGGSFTTVINSGFPLGVTEPVAVSVYPQGAVNPSITNMAVLGNCPSSGNFTSGSSAIRFVYMNEVSTVAAAVALGGFGQGPFTLGIPTVAGSGDTAQGAALALTGAQNAALNANQLYDITGSNSTNTNTYGYQGEAHIARSVTPAGNGTVPQNLLNTLGNILASCVDSASTGSGGGGSYSAACQTLFLNATSDGKNATNLFTATNVPYDTATAAFNIAHFPGGPPASDSGSNAQGQSGYYVSTLFALAGTTGPFQPQLTSTPNDFSVSIQYPLAAVSGGASANPNVSQAESIGIDIDGSVWINSAGTKSIAKFTPQGVLQYQHSNSVYSYGYLSIDPSGNVWTGANNSQQKMSEFTGSGGSYTQTQYNAPGSPFNGTNMYDPYITVTDQSGNAYTSATPVSAGALDQWAMIKYAPAGGSTYLPIYTVVPADFKVAHGAVENTVGARNGDVWFTTEAGASNTTNFVVARIKRSGSAVDASWITSSRGTGATVVANLTAPEMPAIDANNNLWVASQSYPGTVFTFDGVSGDYPTTPTNATTVGGSTPSSTVAGPFGVAIDGAGKVWVANRDTQDSASHASIIEYDSVTNAAVSPTNNFELAQNGTRMPGPLNLIVDQSGVIWITSFEGSALIELLGPGSPTYQPLSTAGGVNKLGVYP